jgi:hypothetical protein
MLLVNGLPGVGQYARRRRAVVFLGLFVALLAAGPLLFCIARLPQRARLHGEGVAYTGILEDKRLSLLASALPRTATAIDFVYWPHVQRTEADFSISEAAFLDWVSAKGWPVKKVSDADQLLVLPLSSAGPAGQAIVVRDGYVFSEKRYTGRDEGQEVRLIIYSLDVIFDGTNGRAHFRFCGGAMKEPWALAADTQGIGASPNR